jgi:hypothetical protein
VRLDVIDSFQKSINSAQGFAGHGGSRASKLKISC